MMLDKICNEIIPVFFVNPRHAVLHEEVKQDQAYVNAFLSAKCSEYCLNTTTWD